MDRKANFASSRAGSNASSRSNSRLGGSTATSSSSKFGLSRTSKTTMGSRSNLYSGSRRGLQSESQVKAAAPNAQIVNERGEDITPRPLIKTEAVMKRNQSELSNASDAHSIQDSASFMQTMRSMFGGSIMEGTSSVMGGSIMGGSFMGSGMDGVGTGTVSRTSTRDDAESVTEEEILTPDDLEKMVNINLSETDTIWLLDIPSTWVAPDSEEAETVMQQNKDYQELCKSRPGNDRYSARGMCTFNEAPKSKHVQTDPVTKQSVEVYASDWDMYDTLEMQDPVLAKESSSHMASHLTSHVTSRATSRAPTRPQTKMSDITTSAAGSTTSLFSVTTGDPNVTVYSSMDGDLEGGEANGEKEALDPTKPNDHPILRLESLPDKLRIVERAITQNVYQSKQARYRNLEVLPDPDNPSSASDTYTVSAPHLNKLWGFKCPLTNGRPVTCIAWNTTNKDIFAVGYGKFNATEEQSPGLVCCWSLKNPEHPERVFYAPTGVTSVSFSHHHPNLLAVALYSGNLVLYNCRSTSHEPVMTSRDALFKHSGPVWQIEWVVKERSMGEDRSEVLVSIGVDGRILQWTIRKGFESLQLMKLKRMLQTKQGSEKSSLSKTKLQQQQKQLKQNQSSKRKQSDGKTAKGKVMIQEQEAYITHHAPGMGFGFCSFDTNIYLVCTEEGYIHKCSCSYNEQFLETYTGHSGPVYRVLWHPMFDNLFLSCSNDWNICLWDQDRRTPLHTFQVTQKQDAAKSMPGRRKTAIDEKHLDQSSQESVWNIDWSPHDPTVFGSVRGGRVELWYMRHNVLDPLIVHKPVSGNRQTFIKFSDNSEILLVGDSKGLVSVYIPKNVPAAPTNKVEALNKVLESLENPTK